MLKLLPAGTYYIGDLCYVLPEKDYDDIVCSFIYDDGEIHQVNGYTFAYANTAYGDGCYRDNSGNIYPVDAGIIGVLRIDDQQELHQQMLQHNIDVDATEGYPHYKHNIFSFDKPFNVSIADGYFLIGGIEIDTVGEDECDEEY